MTTVTVSSKGQIVVPKRIRDALRLKPGMRLQVELQGDRLVLKPLHEGIADHLYGRFRGGDLTDDLEAEHRREMEHDGR